ncbi:MAG TPA: IclR family transcriptional regulator [Streptosporangiaceae bacterium]|nr:IclR family transcriptional regulator [Streptosporangiaceae bacterium]
MTVGDATGSAKALVKGIAIIDLLAAHRKGLRLTDLVRQVDLPRGTVVRLLSVMMDAGLVRHSADGMYRLGPRTAVWGSEFLDALELRDVAADVMAHLAEVGNETCHLGVREGGSVLYIDKVESPHSLRMVSRVGGMNPLHCTGLGKALLAFLSPEEFDRYVAEPLERRTVNTIVAPDILRADMQRTRDRGYALDDVENEVGVRCIGAPIFDHRGELVGSISVAGPTMRMTWARIEQLTDPVIEAAHEISVRLGFGLADAEGV